MRRRKHGGERGFALIMVVIIIAMLAVIGASVLDVVYLGALMAGEGRRSSEARFVAESGNREIVNDEEFRDRFPDFTNLETSFDPSPNSYFSHDSMEGSTSAQTYRGTARLVRLAGIAETTQLARGIFYEVVTEASIGSSSRVDATSEVRSEVYYPTQLPPGTILPRNHAR